MGAGAHRHMLAEMRNGVGRQILEFKSHHIAGIGEGSQLLKIVIGADGRVRSHLEGGRIGRVIVDAGFQTQTRRRHGQHTAKLAATDDADGAARRERLIKRLHLGRLATDRVCFARQASSFFFTTVSDRPRMAAACRAAFLAPASPMAKVATGTPPGIWAMDSRESRLFKARLSTGTPRTGRAVMLATMPGKCAAPPAPAMITFRPRAPALLAYSAMRSGVRCAETIRVS